MQINICHRLIKHMIEKGHVFSYSLTVNQTTIPCNGVPLGVYTTKKYSSGDVITVLSGELRLKPTKSSIHIGNGMHVIDKYGQYINHSFDPSTRIENNKVIAIKDLDMYEEITFNYNDTEINMAEPFEADGIKVCGQTL